MMRTAMCVSCSRVLAAADEPTAHICFHVLLVYLEEQWRLCVQQNQILQRPDYSGMRDFLLVRR